MTSASNKAIFEKRPNLLTDPVFLIGNGKSRNHFDLERLRSIGTIIGCNAIFRDFMPDILVAVDQKMLKEIQGSKLPEDVPIITARAKSVKVDNCHIYTTAKFNTSGCFAMRMIGESMKPSKCYMLGMDGFPGNIYDGTRNYAMHTLQNFDGVHRFYMGALNSSECTTFVNVNHKDGWPPEAENTGKYEHITYEEFEKTVMA